MVRGEFFGRLAERVGSDQAQVGAAGCWTVGLGIELVTGFMRIDLGVAENKCGAACAERHFRHAENMGLEGHRWVDVGDSQYQMIQPVDARTPYRR
jgi:hypothetical protein